MIDTNRLIHRENRFFTIFNRYQVALLLVVAGVLLFARLGLPQIYILDEARNAQAAREMMDRGEWIVPTFNGELRAHKPPLHYYFMQIAYRLFGVNAFAARFFSAVMGLGTLWITWFFTRRFIGAGQALFSVVVLLLSAHFLFEFRLAVPDPYLIFFTSTGVCCFYAFVAENKLRWLLLSALATGMAVLAKGPVALVVPGLSLVVWLLLQKKAALLLSWKMVLFFGVVAVVAVPWFLAVHLATSGEFTRQFFLDHNASRFGETMEGHGGPFFVVLLFVLTGLLPLSSFAGEVVKTWRSGPRNSLLVLGGCVVGAFIAVFSLSATKLPNYPMPCYPFAAMCIGSWLYKSLRGVPPLKAYPFVVLLVLYLLLTAGVWFALTADPEMRSIRTVAFIFLLPAVSAALGWRFYRNLRAATALIIGAMGFVLFNFLFLAIAYPEVYARTPVSKTMHLFAPGEQLYAYQRYNPAYNFYMDKPVEVIHSKAELIKFAAQKPGMKIISREQLMNALKNEGVHLEVLARERDVFETSITVIFRVVE